MTTWYLGGTRGMRDRVGDLTVGTSTVGNSVDVEVRINALDAQGKNMTKLDVLKIIELVEHYIEQNGIPASLGADIPPL